ncbi:hypothetical protein mRhiFer1_009402 [Rhinolophus ferrumequinum]|uniref:Uncharacterized protein n=1 Tax=Rhinolophus ferrumequinum TaxID=59479 RepID=A0A7J7RPM0_RHIFE|nr:hypothetical protein mRhiFer1_009402 [Rhinolophus ferrumequinum]
MLLTALSLNTENTLNEMAQVPDQVSQLEALEARVRLLEEGPHSGDSEAEVEQASGDNVAPNPQAWPILKQRVKCEQPLGPWGVAAGNPAVTEFTTYTPYTPTELQELGRRYRQRPGEPVSAWLLRLWDEGADNILCSPGEMEKLAFVTVHLSLQQSLQNCHRLAQNQGNHTQMEWLTAVVRTVWGQAGELPDTVSQWQSYTELIQIIHEMGMRHAIFNPNMQGPDDELFTASMRDLVLDTAPASAFGSLVAILTPYVGRRIHEVTTAMATLEDVESRRRRKLRQEVHPVETWKPKSKVKGQDHGPQRVTRPQMWCDLLAAGVDREETDRQPNALLLELWKQLRPEQQLRGSLKEKSGKVRPVSLQDFMRPLEADSFQLD